MTNRIKYIFAVIFLSLLFCTVIFIIVREYLLIAYPRYTIGTTRNTYYISSGIKKVRFTYLVDGILYTGSDIFHDGTIVPGGKYWVKFSSKVPDRSNLLNQFPVKDIIGVPESGLKELPKQLPKKESYQFDSLYKKL